MIGIHGWIMNWERISEDKIYDISFTFSSVDRNGQTLIGDWRPSTGDRLWFVIIFFIILWESFKVALIHYYRITKFSWWAKHAFGIYCYETFFVQTFKAFHLDCRFSFGINLSHWTPSVRFLSSFFISIEFFFFVCVPFW